MKAELFREDKDNGLSQYPGVHYLRISEISSAGNLAMQDLRILAWGKDSITFILKNLDTPHVNPEPEKRSIIDQVKEVTNTRRNGYAAPLLNFLRIGILWTEHLRSNGLLVENEFIDPEDVALMMILLKIARQEASHGNDNLIDIMGYVDCMDSIHQQMIEEGYKDGIGDFRDMKYADLLRLRDKLALD